ncbi:hypothetical protein SCG7086_BN_00090 [Chlamydiales bacterium SCGC AG-110-P3]|nr:hypothetical protein SCG7086_BN_00090 [Chlamydiales bacterium SCGC AG-110-P3]
MSSKNCGSSDRIFESDKAPVRSCHRYLSNRKGQLDYQLARKLDLPIGSGKIEGSHRFVIQKRAWFILGQHFWRRK